MSDPHTARGSAPLLLLHGFLGSPESFAPLALPAHEVFAPVLLGHTGCELPSGAKAAPMPATALAIPDAPDGRWGLAHCGFANELDRLAAWARTQHPGPFHLCGYSLGARLALGLSVRHPDLCERLTLISVHPGFDDDAARAKRLSSDVERCRDLELQGVDGFVEQWERMPLFKTQKSLSDAALALQRRVRRSHTARGLIQSLLHCGLGSMPSYGSRIGEKPTTLVTGALDDKFETLARGLRERHLASGSVSGSLSCISVQGVGHNVVLERPDVVSSLLGNAGLSENPTQSARIP